MIFLTNLISVAELSSFHFHISSFEYGMEIGYVCYLLILAFSHLLTIDLSVIIGTNHCLSGYRILVRGLESCLHLLRIRIGPPQRNGAFTTTIEMFR